MRIALLVLFLTTASVVALEPKDVVVIGNKNMPASKEVAEHYLMKRKVPRENLILLDLPTTEDITRPDYDRKLAGPLREILKDRKDAVKVLLTVYGVPLRVGVQEMTPDEKVGADKNRPLYEAAAKEVAELEKAKPVDNDKLAAARAKAKLHGELLYKFSHGESQAAVDSELMLLWFPPYDLQRFQVNPLNWQYPEAKRERAKQVVMTSRLDGPSPAIAMRLVDDAMAVEAAGGLKGKAYVDARGISFDPKKPGEEGTGYEGYDESFRETAAILKAANLDVTLDDKPDVFKADTCPDAALYTGWYSAGNYVPCCKYVQGAVAWHLASYEAGTLRDATSKIWCPNLLKDGVAVTIGPVAEPYTLGFPKPAEFFGYLVTGKYTVVECYAKTVITASWMGVLVADPLYNPYGTTKPGKESAIHSSPKGVTHPFK